MTSLTSISQKEYLKKYLSGDVKKKKRKKITGANIKRSVIVDDDIDLKSMRPLEDDEVELYQMDEDAPQIAGIVDERPPEIKAQEYYSSKRWKVFGGEDGVNIVDSMNKDQHDSNRVSKTLNSLKDPDNVSDREPFNKKCKLDKEGVGLATKEKLKNNKPSHSDSKYLSDKKNIPSDSRSFKSSYPDSDNSPSRVEKNKSSRYEDDSDNSPPRVKKEKSSHYKDDSDASPPRKHTNRNVGSDSDASPPRKKYGKSRRDSDESPPRKESRKKSPNRSSRFEEIKRSKVRNRSCSGSPPRKDKTKKHRYKSDSDNSPPRRERSSHKRDRSDSDVSPPRREKHSYKQGKPDSDTSPPRRTVKQPDKSHSRRRKGHSSDSDNSPPRNERRKSPKPQSSRRRYSRSKSPPARNSLHSRKYRKEKSPKLSRSGISERNDRRQVSDSDESPRRRRKNSEENDSDMSPPRKSSQVNDRPLKKALYKPNDVTSSDEEPNSKSKKMKKTLDGKQAGLQDAKQLKKELSDLKTKEDAMFSKMDASVSGIGAAPVKRDRKTGQIRDLEKEKEAQREKEAKESVVNEKYYKWGKGIKQTEDAAARAAEMMKEMNKPLARYVDDKDLDEFLKAQDREGDPMLEYIKRKQSESTPLQEEKPIYKGSWNPNRFNIRPGYRWDGVVRSNGYEQEWFKTKNAKKARDEEAYKWSTSDM